MSRIDRGASSDIRQRQAFQRQSKLPTVTACGTKALVAGAGTVTAPNVTSSSIVMLTRQIASGTEGHLSVGPVAAGDGFTITSSSGADTSTIGWAILEPGL